MHPLFLKIGTFEIRWYGVMIALGFLAAVWLGNRRGKKAGFEPDVVPNLSFWIILGGLLGARILFVLLNWSDYARNLIEIVRVDHGGIVFYGGLISGLLTFFVYCRIKKLEFWKLVDVMAPSLALAHAFGRMGCFMNGCCWGKECAWPWGIQFPSDSLPALAGFTGHLHPTQLYEAGFLLILCLALMIIDESKKFQGQTFASYGLLYSLFRFIVEFWRGDVPRYFDMTIAQWLSIVIFCLSWWWLTRQRKLWFIARRSEILAEYQKLTELRNKKDE